MADTGFGRALPGPGGHDRQPLHPPDHDAGADLGHRGGVLECLQRLFGIAVFWPCGIFWTGCLHRSRCICQVRAVAVDRHRRSRRRGWGGGRPCRHSDFPFARRLLQPGDAGVSAGAALCVRVARAARGGAAAQARGRCALHAVCRSAGLRADCRGGAGCCAAGQFMDCTFALRAVVAGHQAKRAGRRGGGDQPIPMETPGAGALGRHCRCGWRAVCGGAGDRHAALGVRHAGVGTGAYLHHVRRRWLGGRACAWGADSAAAGRVAQCHARRQAAGHPGRHLRCGDHPDCAADAWGDSALADPMVEETGAR